MAKKTLMGKKKLNQTQEQKKATLVKRLEEFDPEDYTIDYCFSRFIVNRQAKGLSEVSIEDYKKMYKKLENFLNKIGGADALPVSALEDSEIMQEGFRLSLGNKISVQTVNSYLRLYRAFGNYCLEEGYIDYFKCPIKEVMPPVKEVYTDSEINKLLAKPDRTNLLHYRDYMIIMMVLATGARNTTLRNIKLEDVNLEEGYINFNTLKSKGINRVALNKKIHRELRQYIAKIKQAEQDYGIEIEYLFFNKFGAQLSRCGLSNIVASYNKSRGVQKTSTHLLRHTYAKNWITSGGDIISLAQVLNHSELEMVKRYANLYATDIKDEIEQHSTLSLIKTNSGKTLK